MITTRSVIYIGFGSSQTLGYRSGILYSPLIADLGFCTGLEETLNLVEIDRRSGRSSTEAAAPPLLSPHSFINLIVLSIKCCNKSKC